MGKKVNPIIFRINHADNWKSRYLEKKSTETAVHNFKNLEIQDFINRFFEFNNFSTHNIKLSYFNNELKIFISYFFINKKDETKKNKLKPKQLLIEKILSNLSHVNNNNLSDDISFYRNPVAFFVTKNLLLLKKHIKKKTPNRYGFIKVRGRKKLYNKNYFLKIKTLHKKLKKNKKLIKALKNKIRLKNKKNIRKKLKKIKLNGLNTRFIKKLINVTIPNKPTKSIVRKKILAARFKRLIFYKRYYKMLELKILNKYCCYKKLPFLIKFLESLSLFTNNSINISLTLKLLNKFRRKRCMKKIKIMSQLRMYQKQSFYKEGIKTVNLCLINSNSAKMLATFIAFYIKKLKKHNFFFRFLKHTLRLFFKKLSSIKGIKIKIKGRINGAPRSKHKWIKTGCGIPITTLKSKIDYSEVTSFTRKGTFGVKVWVYEKTLQLETPALYKTNKKNFTGYKVKNSTKILKSVLTKIKTQNLKLTRSLKVTHNKKPLIKLTNVSKTKKYKI